MDSNTREYSIPAVWSVLYSDLKGSPWETEDAENASFATTFGPDYVRPVADTLLAAYQLLGDEDAVLAALKAAHAFHDRAFLSPEQFTEMARRLVVRYGDFAEAAQNYLDEHHDSIPWENQNEAGQRWVEDRVCRDSEIWIDEPDIPGVWVFSKPGAGEIR